MHSFIVIVIILCRSLGRESHCSQQIKLLHDDNWDCDRFLLLPLFFLPSLPNIWISMWLIMSKYSSVGPPAFGIFSVPFSSCSVFLMFQMLEDFTTKAQALLVQFDQLMGALRRKDVAGDIGGAKTMLNQHSQLRENINSAAVDSLIQDAHVILKRLDYARSLNKNTVGKYCTSSSLVSQAADRYAPCGQGVNCSYQPSILT